MENKIGARLRELRRAVSMRQEDLADKIGVAKKTLQRWEYGETSPKASELALICQVLGTTEAELLHGPKSEQVKITLVWDRKDVEGEINMNGNGFSLFLGDDGTVGIKGAAKFTSREALKEAAAKILKELELGYDFQVQRGLIKAGE